jgi:YhcH/YjgK/YiaL family protein
MIFDNIRNADLYARLGPRFQQAFAYLQQTDLDLSALPVGRIELDGKALYVMVQEYNSKTPEQGKWEAHRRYIDLQYIVSGTERMGYALLSRLTLGDYNPDKDFQALSGQGDFLTLSSGDFMLLWPNDGHMPGMAVQSPSPVKKVVIKIAID